MTSCEWSRCLLSELRIRAGAGYFGAAEIDSCLAGTFAHQVHLGIFIEPFLDLVLRGKKTVESRFSVRRQSPYGVANSGDILLLKRSGGPVVGVCRITRAWYYSLDPTCWSDIRERFGAAICATSNRFWTERQHTHFATLMRVGDVRRFEPFSISKKDRRGWVVVYRPMERSE